MLKRGDLVLVSGELGAGKTTFIGGACNGLGVEEAVSSPSFIIGRLYQGDPSVAHIDLYRIDSLKGEDLYTLDDYITEERISFVEWPKSEVPLPFKERLRVNIEHAGGDRRRIEIEDR